MADRFEDHRGVIQDMLGPVDAVTEIFTRKGAVRGNHVHERTTQWTYVVRGSMIAAAGGPYGTVERQLSAGQLLEEKAGVPHAWKALEDTTVLVFTRGPRSGEAYETDTRRLGIPLLTAED
jgi:quercetin dioxygenase-like cupin family protein